MIKINELTFSYSSSLFRKKDEGSSFNSRKIFDDFSIEFKENRIYGLLGKNGTGKSTLLYIIAGLLRPCKGHVYFNDIETKKRMPETLQDIFIVPEEYDLPSMKLSRYIKMNRVFYPNFSDEILNNCLSSFDMPKDLNLKHLSMGQKKKIYLSFALATNTKLLLMDEPTNGLDIPSKSIFRSVIAENMSEDRTLIMSTHQIHDIESLLDHVVMIDRTMLLLNKSVQEISNKYSFNSVNTGELSGDILYSEPSLNGNNVIVNRKETDKETQINLELLFNAICSGKINMNNE